MAIYYVWGYAAPAPHRLGNAERLVSLHHHNRACDVASEAGFDMAQLAEAGTSTWATAYVTPDDRPFEPGEDGDLVAGYVPFSAPT